MGNNKKGQGAFLRNQLTAIQKFQLNKYLEECWVEIEKEEIERDAFAQQAERALGFNVTACNVVTATEVIGKRWPSSSQNTPMSNMYNVLRREIDQLAERLAFLEKQLGVTPE